MAKITDRLIHAWNAFNRRDPTPTNIGIGNSYDPSKNFVYAGIGDRSIVTSIINRIAVDCAAIDVIHAKVDENGNFKEELKTKLNSVVSFSANIDQPGRAFIQDAVTSMCDEGVVALIPTDIDLPDNEKVPNDKRTFEVLEMRTAKVLEWYPKHVRVEVYNEKVGQKIQKTFPKSICAIVENPFYDVMNRPNSTLQRLIRTLKNLDILDEKNSSGKLDLILQLPYVIKSETRQEQAEKRRKLIEEQLIGSKYGIAYIDGTERITQLNRPVENNLWNQAKELTDMLFNQLGLTPEVFNGTADESVMLNYYNRTVEPIMAAFTGEMERKFLSDDAISEGQRILFFRKPFKLVPVSQIAEIADKFTRNEILTPNEIRGVIGYKPSGDPKSDELRNRNINESSVREAEKTKMPPKEETSK